MLSFTLSMVEDAVSFDSVGTGSSGQLEDKFKQVLLQRAGFLQTTSARATPSSPSMTL